MKGIDLIVNATIKAAGQLAHMLPSIYPPTTGSDVQIQFSRMKARLVARYRLESVRGRPEELVSPVTSRGVSLGYGSRTIRVRLMDGRNWVEAKDFQVEDKNASRWQDELDAFVDPWIDPRN